MRIRIRLTLVSRLAVSALAAVVGLAARPAHSAEGLGVGALATSPEGAAVGLGVILVPLLALASLFLWRWHRAEAAQRELRVFEQAVGATPNGIIVTGRRALEGPVLYVNAAFERISGYSRTEALAGLGRLFQACDKPEAKRSEIGQVHPQRRAVKVEMATRRKDGAPLWLEANVSPLFDDDGEVAHHLWVIVDITHRKEVEASAWEDAAATERTLADLRRAQAATEETARRFRDFAEASPGWFWETDAALRLSRLSDRCEMLKGTTPSASLLGKTWAELRISDGGDADTENRLRELEERRGFRNLRLSCRLADGETRHLKLYGVPVFGEDASFRGYRGTGIDITAEVEIGMRARQSEARLRDAIESLSDGFALFDAEERLVVCNSRYSELYSVGEQPITEGVRFETLLRDSAAAGLYQIADGKTEHWVAERLKRFRDPHGPNEQLLSDGRWIRCSEYRISTGGTICLHGDITDLKRTEKRLLDAINSIPDGFVLYDSVDRLVLCNQHFRALYRNLADDELVGQRFQDVTLRLVEGDLADLGDAPSADAWLTDWKRHHQFPGAMPFILQLNDGRTIEVHERRTGDGGRVGICVDTTTRRAAELALRESEAMFRGLLTASADAMVVLDDASRIIIANAQAETLFGYEAGGLLGVPVARLMPERCWAEHLKPITAYLADPASRSLGGRRELAMQRGDRSEFPVEMSLTGHQRGPGGVVLVAVRDLTARKEAEEALRRAQKMEALGTLAGGIAHDLNNTLVPILALAKLTARTTPEGSAARENLTDIVGAAKRAKDLVQQILTFSRSEGVEHVDVDLATAVTGGLKLVRSGISTTINLRAEISPGPLMISGSETQIHQALMNLCSNAAQAIGAKPGEIAVVLRRWSSDEANAAAPGLRRGDYAGLTVIDDGCGMDEATKHRIFDPFFTTKGVGEGTGLGLSIVHGVVSAHGGAIAVQTSPGHGTRFDLLFPVAASAKSAPEHGGADRETAPPRISNADAIPVRNTG